MADTYNGLYLEPDWIPALLLLAPSELGRLIRCAIFYSSSGKAMDLPGKERVCGRIFIPRLTRDALPHTVKRRPLLILKRNQRQGGWAKPCLPPPRRGKKQTFRLPLSRKRTLRKSEKKPPPYPLKKR